MNLLPQRRILFLTCFFLLYNISTLDAQKCERGSFFDLLFTILESGDNYSKEEIQPIETKPKKPVKRTENTVFKVGLNFMGAPKDIGYVPSGFEMGIYSRIFSSEKLYFGVSSTLYPLKFHSYDSTFNAYDKIVTRRNIFSFNLGLKYNFIQSKRFQMAFGIHVGTMVFNARTFAQDNTCDCEGNTTPNRTLKTFNSAKPDYGASLSMEFALRNPYDKIYIEAVRQTPGNTTYLEKNGIEIRPNQIDYSLVENNWNMMVFKIGYSHYF